MIRALYLVFSLLLVVSIAGCGGSGACVFDSDCEPGFFCVYTNSNGSAVVGGSGEREGECVVRGGVTNEQQE